MQPDGAAPKIVLPGDRIPFEQGLDEVGKAIAGKIRVGPGLHHENGELVAVKAGSLRSGAGNRWWVEGSQKRYVPAVNESVLGIVTARHAEGYRVDIGAAHAATLPALAFEGATKRTKPSLEVGSLVYARVTTANRDMDPELECVNPATAKADGYGELKEGHMVRCSLSLARSLLLNDNPIFAILAEAFPFETAVGLNGRVWINAASARQIIATVAIIRKADHVSNAKVPQMVKAYLKQMADDMDES
ncbi:hypothetical protein BDK51DRAFT_36326 [Blyttiomyces helicus]|uniref:Ribosomal RNA-processing protein 40 n=1 Tax=Blyttiomyces helicus TaxID=388810 RepID=A0A4P9WEF2_9FUNG|nr:hypothetical protein BDK51DRAFT_36326 [Blyttiomyces helicus]|eukprot:RKO90772.1 hypothetical protein BDK51DRAFT_36326 [Blyttiomyces helicus]